MDASDDTTLRGLSSPEVADRVARGLVNANADVRTKSVGEIVRTNALTLFNAVNLALALLVAVTGEYRNMLFVGVVLTNFLIGVYQELRAKRMVDRLSILTRQDVRVVRDGVQETIPVERIVVDDLVVLSRGDQVPADCLVVDGVASANESLLTGEADPIAKVAGDELLSGSFLDSGSVRCRVTRVGGQSYAAGINAEAKCLKPVRSEIRETLRAIIRLATTVMGPLGLGLFLRTLHSSPAGVDAAILSTVAAVVGMIPQGLVLLASTVLAIATSRLARQSVLVQQPYCVEALARVDTLCLDKTGTITSGRMRVTRVTGPTGAVRGDAPHVALVALATVAGASGEDANETARAIAEHARREGAVALRVSQRVPFDSLRKYSGCVTDDGRAFVMGATRFVLGVDRAEEAADALASFCELERVLVVAEVGGFDASGGIVGEPCVLGYVGLEDEVRDTAARTMAYFVGQGVELRVISGDDPRTVSAIAARAGIPDAGRYVDASTLVTAEQLERAVGECRVFGRVTPQQKREMVRVLQEGGRTVAMTGDGVNDVLALRRADCSVAMASGSAAARNVSEIVLVDDDFAHMPEVVAEGRRSINNLERSASLFLVKTVFSAVLALVCVVLPPYPFVPIQMTLISSAVIGIPSFVLALEPNHERVRGDFLARVLSKSMPASASIALALLATIVIGRAVGLGFEQLSTVCTAVTASVGVALIVRISQPLTPLRRVLVVGVVAILVLGCTAFAPFFRVVTPTVPLFILEVALCACAVGLFGWLYNRSVEALGSGSLLTRLARRLEDTDGRGRWRHHDDS